MCSSAHVTGGFLTAEVAAKNNPNVLLSGESFGLFDYSFICISQRTPDEQQRYQRNALHR